MTTPTSELSSLTDLNTPTFTAPGTTQSVASAPVEPTTPPAQIAASTPLMGDALDAMGEVEFSKFVDALEGDDEINTSSLQSIAKKMLAGPLKEAFKAKHKNTALEQVVSKLAKEIEDLRSGQKQTTEQLTTAQDEQQREQRFSKLSSECKGLGFDLGTALADTKVQDILNNQGKDDTSALVLSQEISQWMLRGEFKKAAALMRLAVEKATPSDPAASKPLAPDASSGTAVTPVEKTYEQELSEITHAYSRSQKTFADSQARAARMDALKKKHGRV